MLQIKQDSKQNKMNYLDVIEDFMQLEINERTDPEIKRLQTAVGLLVTEVSHQDNKIQAILNILSIDLNKYEQLDESLSKAPLVGIITLE